MLKSFNDMKIFEPTLVSPIYLGAFSRLSVFLGSPFTGHCQCFGCEIESIP